MDKSISVILTVHNKEKLVGRVMRSILDCISMSTSEIIIVLDGCKDNSKAEILRAVEEAPKERCEKEGAAFLPEIIIMDTPDVYEIKANNAGLKQSRMSYSLMIQDDMVINEKGFDRRLLNVFLKYPDLFAVSGRAAHNVVKSECPNPHILTYTDLMGWDNRPDRDRVYIRDVVNRGPLMFENARLRELNFLDESFCPYNQDDHDICFRAFRKGWLCGSAWVDYVSPPEWGTSRQKNLALINKMIINNMFRLYDRHKDLIDGPKHNEARPI